MSGDFDAWVGRAEEAVDAVTPKQARQMAATLGLDAVSLADGDPLPPLWHWMGWLPETPMAGLGPDGHPARGGFLPPVPLERRMWVGAADVSPGLADRSADATTLAYSEGVGKDRDNRADGVCNGRA